MDVPASPKNLCFRAQPANMLQPCATCCNPAQHAATLCNMLQRCATCCHAATMRCNHTCCSRSCCSVVSDCSCNSTCRCARHVSQGMHPCRAELGRAEQHLPPCFGGAAQYSSTRGYAQCSASDTVRPSPLRTRGEPMSRVLAAVRCGAVRCAHCGDCAVRSHAAGQRGPRAAAAAATAP